MNRLLLSVVVLVFVAAGCSPQTNAAPPTVPAAPIPSPTGTSTPPPTSLPTATAVPATQTPGPMLSSTPAQPVDLVVYSAWEAGSDRSALGSVIEKFRQTHSYVNWVNVTSDKKAIEKNMVAGAPLDAYDTNIGYEFFTKWVSSGYMEPLDDVYDHYQLDQVFPRGLIQLVSYDGHQWGIPVSIYRSNTLWYNKSLLQADGIDPEDLHTFSGWEAAAQRLQAAGITPLAFGDKYPWEDWQLFEVVLEGTLGPEQYSGLWNGTTDWTSPEVGQALENLKMLLQYTNQNHSRLEWYEAYAALPQGHAAMFVMGDWMVGEFASKGFDGYGWTSPPGTAGAFIVWPDGFALPKSSTNPDVAKELLAYMASKEAQEGFNRDRGGGSICARTDCSYAAYSAYSQSSAVDFAADALVPSAARAVAVSETWTKGYVRALSRFLSTGNVKSAQSDFAAACKAASICK